MQPSFSALWRDADGDYSSDEDDEADPASFNQVRVVVRIRPFLQGESVMQKRSTNTSGQMHVDTPSNSITLRYDARNKEAKSFKFDKVCDGQVDQRAFYKEIGVKQMVKQVVNGFHATIFAYG